MWVFVLYILSLEQSISAFQVANPSESRRELLPSTQKVSVLRTCLFRDFFVSLKVPHAKSFSLLPLSLLFSPFPTVLPFLPPLSLSWSLYFASLASTFRTQGFLLLQPSEYWGNRRVSTCPDGSFCFECSFYFCVALSLQSWLHTNKTYSFLLVANFFISILIHTQNSRDSSRKTKHETRKRTY